MMGVWAQESHVFRALLLLTRFGQGDLAQGMLLTSPSLPDIVKLVKLVFWSTLLSG